MDKEKRLPWGPAICYSGYRRGQSPRTGVYPSREQILEDLRIVSRYWNQIRLYDISLHAERVLEIVRTEKLPLRIMLGNDLRAEMNNPDCPWGAEYSQEQLELNKAYNEAGVEKLVLLCNSYDDVVSCASIGNEASVDWTDHLVKVGRLEEFADSLRERISQPLTFCENYLPWPGRLKALGEKLDIISLHSYPLWEYKSVDEALAYTMENYRHVKSAYPDKQVIITEAGWCTKSNGRGMDPENASLENQRKYIRELVEWSRKEEILCFLFEAFDEPWKGSDDPDEPEKHWGLFHEDRSPKPVMQAL